jgi:ABC-type nitrate/sulfonate/bicarbonate transport system substrate-binding protein
MIKIGMVNLSLNMLDHHVALANGHYKQHGLEVELVAPSGKEAIRALASGEITVSSYTSKVMDAILKERMPFKFVLFTRNGVPHYIVARPEIRSPKDLRGKTLWTGGQDGTNYYMTLDWLRANGLEPGVDVRLVSYDNAPSGFLGPKGLPDWARATLKGAADAMMIQVLERALLMEHFGYNSLVDLPEAYPGRMIHGLAAHVDTIQRNPDTIRRIVKGHIAAARTIKEDKNFCVTLISEKWGVSQRVAEEAWRIIRTRFISEIDPKWLMPEIEYFQRHVQEQQPGRIIDIPDTASLVDSSFANSERKHALGSY